MNRDRVIHGVIAALAVCGIALMALGDRPRSGPAAAPTDPDAAHAAAGITTGPAVAAAFDARRADLERRVQAAPTDRGAVLELARLLHDGHRTDEAVPHYRTAIALAPDDAVPYYDLAAALGELGDWGGARAALLDRLARAPDDATALYDLGVVEMNLGDQDAATSWWERARAAAPDDPGLRERIDDALARTGSAPDPHPPRPPR